MIDKNRSLVENCETVNFIVSPLFRSSCVKFNLKKRKDVRNTIKYHEIMLKSFTTNSCEKNDWTLNFKKPIMTRSKSI